MNRFSLSSILRTLPLLAGVGLVGTGCIASTDPGDTEDAQTSFEPSDVGLAQEAVSAPSCVYLYQDKWDGRSRAYVRNDCSTSQRFRMIWRWASDGACVTLDAFQERRESKSDTLRKDPYVTELRKC